MMIIESLYISYQKSDNATLSYVNVWKKMKVIWFAGKKITKVFKKVFKFQNIILKVFIA